MMHDSAVLVDTNVLLTATTPSRTLHKRALKVLNQWPNRVRLCTSGQILREYMVVATRPLLDNGLGLTRRDALANVDSFVERMLFLEEGWTVHQRLTTLLRTAECAGKQIHDANVVATALSHGVGGVLTENVDDFRFYSEMVNILDLRDEETILGF